MSPLVKIHFVAQGSPREGVSKTHPQVRLFAGARLTVDWPHVPGRGHKVFLRLRTGPKEFTGAWFEVIDVWWADSKEHGLIANVHVLYYCDEGSTEGDYR